jgi:predicted ArsR family transcriptional regulator
MKTTRQQIREYLQDKQIATAEELARALRVTPANVRHHLAVLVTDGLVERVGERPPTGRGRPVQLYSLAETRSRHNLILLVDAFLTEIEERCSDEERIDLEKRLANYLVKDRVIKVKNPGQRFYQAIQLLNTMNYQARWEAHANAPHVIFSHCPYAAVIQKHPELCQMDAYLLEELFGEVASQSTKLELTPKGTRQCVFLVGGHAPLTKRH